MKYKFSLKKIFNPCLKSIGYSSTALSYKFTNGLTNPNCNNLNNKFCSPDLNLTGLEKYGYRTILNENAVYCYMQITGSTMLLLYYTRGARKTISINEATL